MLFEGNRCINPRSSALAFDALFAKVKRLEMALTKAERAEPPEDESKRRAGGKGRRDLAKAELPVVRAELAAPELEIQVLEGKAPLWPWKSNDRRAEETACTSPTMLVSERDFKRIFNQRLRSIRRRRSCPKVRHLTTQQHA